MRLLIETQAREAGEEKAFWDAVNERFIELLRAIVAHRTVKEVAYCLGVDPATISHALEGRNRYAVHAHWIPRLIAMAPNDEALDFLASLRGRETIASKPLTPEEEVAAWRSVAAEMPPEMREVMERKVRAYRKRGGVER